MEFFPTARARRLNRLSKELRVTLPVRLSELRNLAAMVEAFGDENQLPETKVFAINLELDELITNTVAYGNFGALDPKIEILLRIKHGVLTLTMKDNGKPFDPTFDTEPNTTSPRPWSTPGQELRRPGFLRVRGGQEPFDVGARAQSHIGITSRNRPEPRKRHIDGH